MVTRLTVGNYKITVCKVTWLSAHTLVYLSKSRSSSMSFCLISSCSSSSSSFSLRLVSALFRACGKSNVHACHFTITSKEKEKYVIQDCYKHSNQAGRSTEHKCAKILACATHELEVFWHMLSCLRHWNTCILCLHVITYNVERNCLFWWIFCASVIRAKSICSGDKWQDDVAGRFLVIHRKQLSTRTCSQN